MLIFILKKYPFMGILDVLTSADPRPKKYSPVKPINRIE